MALFITFEGPEGSGKSTQIQLLAGALRQAGQAVTVTREPGGTRIGNAVRTILLAPEHTEMSQRAEALLFNAARAQLVDQVIKPALARGETVLCDRFGDSTVAYQGYGRKQPLAPLEQIIQFATTGLTPDLTLYLDLDVRVGLERKRTGVGDAWNRMEEETLAFHERVRQGYLDLAATAPRWLVVDATQDVAAVQAVIWLRVRTLLATSGVTYSEVADRT
ncbi:MAG: dTMP kinase [Anaerolineales bacterium]|nr:dTMP kinase [Anaerolineales bacterium]